MAETRPLRVLWVATKAPWPPRDGGRLLQLETLRLLASAGGGEPAVEVELVAPAPRREHEAIARALASMCSARLVDAGPLPLPLAMMRAIVRAEPVTAARHRLGAVAREVSRAAEESAFDVVHAEQVQAMPQALAARLPVLLRAQNVESELWRGAIHHRGDTAGDGGPTDVGSGAGVEHRPNFLTGLRRREARRLARWEASMLREAALTLAVTERDAATLSALAPGARIEALPVPFPAELPPGPALPGAPALALLAGAGWQPNREGADAFVAGPWPHVLRALPEAQLHVFGDVKAAARGVSHHPAPADPAAAFPAGAILVVPLAVASGVRMKVLEAWARGLPVVATPAAAAGLAATSGEQLLVAEMGQPLADALLALAGDAALRDRLVRSARELLRRRHAPSLLRARLLSCYAAAAGASGPGRR